LYIKHLYSLAFLAIFLLGMPKEKKPTPSDDTDSNKQPQNFRFTAETIRKLEEAARDYGMSKTAYAELALKDRFKKDGIK
jgi:TraY domain